MMDGSQQDGFVTMWGHVAALPDQLETSFAAGAPELPRRPANEVLVCGMGGSAAAAEILRGVIDPARLGLSINRDYGLRTMPAPDALLVFSSYSGHTEEVLSAWDEAERIAPSNPRAVITSGGELGERARRSRTPWISIPGGLPPRASLGHGIGALASVLEAVADPGLAVQVPETVARLRDGNRRWGLDARPTESRLVELAGELHGRWPVIYSGCPLAHAAARRWRAQLNENAKMFAGTAELPELDHNEVVGWGQDSVIRQQARVIALRDESERPSVARRFAATQEALGLDERHWFECSALSGSPLSRIMDLVQQGDALSCLLAREAGLDPVPVVVIDRIKARLARD